METLILILIVLIALLHVGAFLLESVLWRKPFALKIFGTTPESAAATRTIALNQGVYNLFLAAGLIWSLMLANPAAFEARVFFLSCVAVAGLVGGLSVSKRIWAVQALPAFITLALVFFSY